jgi:energy-converting hydrogenase A subunit B
LLDKLVINSGSCTYAAILCSYPIQIANGRKAMDLSLELQLIHIAVAVIACLILFITIDLIFNLPKEGGVKGVDEVSETLLKSGGNKAGATMMGNIVCSPDASAGTLLAACGVYAAGLPGGLLAAVLVFIGNRICNDPGYAGTTGAVLATVVIVASTYVGFDASLWIAAMVIAIVLVQALSHIHASQILGRLWSIREGKK